MAQRTQEAHERRDGRRTRGARALQQRARRAWRQGRHAFAIACLRRAIESHPASDARRAGCFCDLGDICQHEQRDAEALEAYVHALRLAPHEPEVHLAIGRALGAQRLFLEARPLFERALRLAPDRADVLCELGDLLYAGQSDVSRAQAIAQYERALQIDPHELNAWRGLARVHADRNDWQEALASIERGLALARRAPLASRPSRSSRLIEGRAELLIDKADLLLRRSESEQRDARTVEQRPERDARPVATDIGTAIESLRAALNIHPRDVRACRLLVDALERLDRDRDGLVSDGRDLAGHAANRVDDTVGAWVALGAALEAAGELRDAAKAYERAIARKPDCLRAWFKLGDVHLALAEPDDAVRCFDAAAAIDPEHPSAHVNLGWALRMAGDFARGWKESAWNYCAGDKRRFEQPVWDGAPLADRTLLLWADFALGDTIQDLRYLTRVRAAHPHARLVLECDRRLVSLLDAQSAPAAAAPLASALDAIVANKAPLPSFDLHLPLRRLPEVLGVELASIPADVPYLVADPDRASRWTERLRRGDTHEGNPRKAIGIVWAGDQTRADARTKSASLADFAPLAQLQAELPGLRIISLQLGPNVDELVAPPPGLHVERVLDEDCDVAETAAVMSALDAIVTVDTMTAHLAGALGKPVWVLASYAPAWWLWHIDPQTGNRSRWYPIMRIVRQPRAGDWEDVMQRVCEALRSEVHVP